jgi:exodeoxyribonuclease-5
MLLSDEQKDICIKLLTNVSREPVQTLGGYAGTGKTTVIAHLVHKLQNYAVCAFTGKAANVLRKKGISHAATIHSTIYRQPYEDEDGDLVFDTMKTREELGVNGFIVDEGSMVGAELDSALRSYGLPIIYVGDHGQLEPVGSDFNLMGNPQYKLETVHRNAGEIAHFAEHLRKGQPASTFERGDKVQVCTKFDLNDDILIATDQIICAYNAFRCRTNRHLRSARGYKKQLVVGEKVICLRNNKRLGLFNGMQGTVQRVHGGHRMDFLSNGILHPKIYYDPHQFGKERLEQKWDRDAPNPFDWADCITCHKAQGDEWDNIIVYQQNCDKWDMRRWNYTAASRAKHSIIWVQE